MNGSNESQFERPKQNKSIYDDDDDDNENDVESMTYDVEK
jgi:hypothetical protein